MKKRFPEMKVAGSAVIAEVLSKPSAISLIDSLNGGGFEPFALDVPLKDGYIMDLGNGVKIHVIETPGHSRCSLTYYVEPDRVMIFGESGGIPLADGYIKSDFLSSFDAYMDSLEKVDRFDARVLCLPHGGVLAGESAEGYFKMSQEAAVEFKGMIENLINAGGEEEEVVSKIRDWEVPTHGIGQADEPYIINLRAMVRTIKKRGRKR